MKIFLSIFFFILSFNSLKAENNLIFYLESAYKNNPKLNAERQSLNATKENINISKSEFLPSISIDGEINSIDSSNRTNQSGSTLSDLNNEKISKTLSIDQKVFQGLQGYNSLKKSQLEVKKADYKLKQVEQEVILDSVSAYFDLIYKIDSKKFNLVNIDIFERQVETDSARLQRGEITLTDLAQSESTLAGAKAKYITASTELLTTTTNFKRIIGLNAPEANIEKKFIFNSNLPSNLVDALQLSNKNNPNLISARLDYEISKKEVNIEKAQLSPKASINYSKSKIDNFSSTIDKTDQESLKATIKWPIISGGKNYSSLKKSRYKERQSNLILIDVTNKIKTETTNVWSLFQSAGSILTSTQAQVKAAEIANEGITLEYDSGDSRTTLDVIQSRSLLLEARIANAKAKRDFMISKFKLLFVTGNLTLTNLKKS